MLLDIEQRGNSLLLSYFDKDGKTAFKKYQFNQFKNWVVCGEKDRSTSNEFKNWDGRPVKQIKGKRLDKHATTQFLEELPQEDKDEIFSFELPKKYFIDIEVEVSKDFPDPNRAPNPVTTIAIVTPNHQTIVLGTKDLPNAQQLSIQKDLDSYFEPTGHKYSFQYQKFDSEYDLLFTFFTSFVKKFPMMSGWNVINFDWTYLVNRAKRLSLDPSIASPSNRLQGQALLPVHVAMLDYLDVYRKWDRTVAIKENYKLDTVADTVVGLQKIKYDGTLQDLFEQDYEKYVFYNVVDTVLVQLIDEKINTMEIALTLANICKISIYKAASPVSITESLICRKLLEDGKVMAKDWDAIDGHKDTQYAGAYVKKPKLGKHQAVACFDFASLYPSIMRQMNISPDALITKLDPDYDTIRPEVKDHVGDWNRATMTKEKRKEVLDAIGPDKIVSINGSVYKKEDSILKQILGDLYSKRKEYKKTSFELEQKAYELEKQLN